MNKWDGDIIFKTPTREHLRIKGDGSILVNGKVVERDKELVDGFRAWFRNTRVTLPDGSKGHVDPEANGGIGDYTLQSGVGVSAQGPGGDVVMEYDPSRGLTQLGVAVENLAAVGADYAKKHQALIKIRNECLSDTAIRSELWKAIRTSVADAPWVSSVVEGDPHSMVLDAYKIMVGVAINTEQFQAAFGSEATAQAAHKAVNDLLSKQLSLLPAVVDLTIIWNGYAHEGS